MFKNLSSLILGFVIGVVATISVLLIQGSLTGAGESVVLKPLAERPTPLSAPKMEIHVVGAVTQPGVYQLAFGSRVQDAVDAAGGALANADLESVNLAAILADGEQVKVGQMSVETRAEEQADGGLVDINSADQATLEALPRIGKVLASAIIDYRTQNGAFTSLDDLLKVPGIDNEILEAIRPLVVINK